MVAKNNVKEEDLKRERKVAMKKSATTITGVMFIVFAFWGFSWAAEDIKVIGYLNINKASIEELQMLPDIDEKTAENIVYFREANGPFFMVDDLLKVKGMNTKKFESIRPVIRTEGESTLRVVGL